MVTSQQSELEITLQRLLGAAGLSGPDAVVLPSFYLQWSELYGEGIIPEKYRPILSDERKFILEEAMGALRTRRESLGLKTKELARYFTDPKSVASPWRSPFRDGPIMLESSAYQILHDFEDNKGYYYWMSRKREGSESLQRNRQRFADYVAVLDFLPEKNLWLYAGMKTVTHFRLSPVETSVTPLVKPVILFPEPKGQLPPEAYLS